MKDEQAPIIYDTLEPVYNEDGTLKGHVFRPPPGYKVAMQRHLIPFVIREPEVTQRMIRKVIKIGETKYIQYTPAPDGYKPASDETVVCFHPNLITGNAGASISEASIPSSIPTMKNNFPTKF